jgi:hypothetical protein
VISQGGADDAAANVSSMGAGTIPAFDWLVAYQLVILSGVGACGDKSFFDHDALCAGGAGCACGGTSQNSFQALRAILGDS